MSGVAVAVRVLVGLSLAVLLSACSGGAGAPKEAPSPSPTQTQSSSPTPSALPTRPPTPKVGQCRMLRTRDVIAPTSRRRPVACDKKHTARTYHVGRLDLDLDGHRLAVDSPAAQRQPRDACTKHLTSHLGASERELRLSMARAMWFTPTVAEAAAGADWFRCDVVVATGNRDLAPLPGPTAGLGQQDVLAMCATDRPGSDDFRRVPCSEGHAWRAVTTVDLPGKEFPSVKAVADAMAAECRSAALDSASDPLDFEWSEERPTREQWAAGQRYGICWVPDLS